jgi:hypothetical protein
MPGIISRMIWPAPKRIVGAKTGWRAFAIAISC